MFDGLFTPVRLDSPTLPARNDQPWESATIYREAPEVTYTVQAQCDDDYFLSVSASQKSLLSKMLPIALQQRVEKLMQRLHGVQG